MNFSFPAAFTALVGLVCTLNFMRISFLEEIKQMHIADLRLMCTRFEEDDGLSLLPRAAELHFWQQQDSVLAGGAYN